MSKASLRTVFFSAVTISSFLTLPTFVACIDETSNQLPGGGKGKGSGGSKGGGSDAGDRESGTGDSGSGGAGTGGAVVGSGGASGSGGAEATGGADQGTGGENTGTGGAVVEAGVPDASDGGPEGGTPVTVSAPADLPDVSADDYKDNVHGIITGDTLKRWIADWTANRPSGVTGKLVVLQIVPGVAASVVHVAEKGTSVASYVVPSSELTQVRDNGLSRIEAEIPNGPAADAFLKKYGIEANDYVVLTFEQLADTQSSIVQSVGRAWLLLRYWGYAKERIGILNGSVNWNATTHGLVNTTPQQTPPNNGRTSVRDLRVDNTAYVITLGGLLDVYKGASGAVPLANVSLVDARGGAEALGLQKATSTGKTNCASYTGTGVNARCSPPFEGRLKGANSVPWTQFLKDGANGFQFLSKAEAKAVFDAQSHYTAGQLTIQYCRTNQRSMVTGLVANVILGYPTRFYDTSFIEWSHLSYGPTPLTRILPENSSYRTDLATLTQHADVSNYTPGGSIEGVTINGWVDGPNYNAEADISTTPPLVTPTANTTNLSIETDRAYKLQ